MGEITIPPPATPPVLPPGFVVGGKYEVLHLHGVGGMGAVYEARNTWTDRRVALKLLHPKYAKNPEIVRCFLREAKAASKIAHPNIVDILDMGQDADTGALFIVLEFLVGEDLAKRINGEPRLTMRESLLLMVPVMSALVAAHRHRVVHRDIKPENVFLTRVARGGVVPKLIDFGISKILEEAGGDPSKSLTSSPVGTPEYMSPEQARCRSDIDGRADVWSVGVVLYELVAGRLPFDSPNHHMLIMAILTTPAPRLERRVPGVPPGLARVIHRALEPEVGDRYQSMAEFLGALLDCDLGDGVPLVEPEARRAYLTGSRTRDSAGPLVVSRPPEACTTPLAPTVPEHNQPDPIERSRKPTADDTRGAHTMTRWQKRPPTSWIPAIDQRRMVNAVGAAIVVVSSVFGGVAIGRRSAGGHEHPVGVPVSLVLHHVRGPAATVGVLSRSRATDQRPTTDIDAGLLRTTPRRPVLLPALPEPSSDGPFCLGAPSPHVPQQ